MSGEFVLEMKGICKRFGGIKALDCVGLHVRKGEVHAIMGENGAGKSTLMKILGGAYTKDSGEIWLEGEKVQITNPIVAQKLGVAVIYQEQALIGCLTVADNILLGRIPNKGTVINKTEHLEAAKEAMEAVGAVFDPNMLVSRLTVAQRQFVEIAKAISMDAKIIVMDEPTSVLTLTETEILFKLIRKLQEQGCSIIYISHRLEELYQIVDTITIMKDGCTVGTRPMSEVNNDLLIKMMTGRDIPNIFPQRIPCGNVRMEVKGISRGKDFQDISFTAAQGEIVGMAGLVGSGRTEIARALFGLEPAQSGEVILDGVKLRIKRPRDALENGIVYITEDRKGDGIFLEMSIRDNMTISVMEKYSTVGIIDQKTEKSSVDELRNLLSIKCQSDAQAIGQLSGGNQQKVMIARGLLVDSKIVIIDEPTRGVDVGTKAEIYKIIRSLAEKGKAVIVISSELPEVLGLSDKIVVLHQGRIAGVLEGTDATEHQILSYATGGISS